MTPGNVCPVVIISYHSNNAQEALTSLISYNDTIVNYNVPDQWVQYDWNEFKYDVVISPVLISPILTFLLLAFNLSILTILVIQKWWRRQEEIAKTKMEDLNANTLEAAVKIISGSARSMGITVEK